MTKDKGTAQQCQDCLNLVNDFAPKGSQYEAFYCAGCFSGLLCRTCYQHHCDTHADELEYLRKQAENKENEK